MSQSFTRLRVFSRQRTYFLLFPFHPVLLLGLLALSLFSKGNCQQVEPPLIMITQITAHPSLDLVREGVLAALKEQGLENEKTAKILTFNAMGSPVTMAQIAQKVGGMKPQVAIGISTPSAQSLVKAAENQFFPVIFASVTDPLEARLVKQLAPSSENRTAGTRNFSPLKEQLQLVKDLFPQAKTIGVLANPGEANSAYLLKSVRKEAQATGFTLKESTVRNTTDTLTAVKALGGKVDVLFLLQDNTVASSLSAFMKVARELNLPVISSYEEAIFEGAVASLAYDEFEIGRQTGKIASLVVKGKPVSEIGVQDPTQLRLVINRTSLQKLGIVLPLKVQEHAKIYEEPLEKSAKR